MGMTAEMKVGMARFGTCRKRGMGGVERSRGELRQCEDHFGCGAGDPAASRGFSRAILSGVAGDDA